MKKCCLLSLRTVSVIKYRGNEVMVIGFCAVYYIVPREMHLKCWSRINGWQREEKHFLLVDIDKMGHRLNKSTNLF